MAKGGILIDRFGPEVGHLNYLAVPGVGDIWIFVRACDYKSFPRRGISVTFDLKFLPCGREFDSNFLENVNIPPYAPPPPHPA